MLVLPEMMRGFCRLQPQIRGMVGAGKASGAIAQSKNGIVPLPN